MLEIEQIWGRITKQLQICAPEIYEAIRQAEKFHGVAFPEEVKALYRLQNGIAGRWYEGAWRASEEIRARYLQPEVPSNIVGMVDTWEILSLECMCRTWECSREESMFSDSGPIPGPDEYLYTHYTLQEMEELPFLPLGWHPHWLHFMGSLFGRYYIDLAPRPKGQIGQIISWSGGYEQARIIASNLQALLTTIVQELEDGKYTFDKRTGVLWSQGAFSSLDKERLRYLKFLRRRGSKP